MGFFDSVINGLSDAGGWISDNSDSILKVAGTIASLIPAAENKEVQLDDSDNLMPVIHLGLASNANYLTQLMDTALPTTTESAIDSTSTTTWADLPGLWPDPSIMPSSSGYPRSEIISDIGKFLAANNIPNILQGSQGPIDLAHTIAGDIMENSNSKISKAGDPSPTIQSEPFTFSDKAAGLSLTGRHIYYQIPLGMAGAKQAWHSLVRVGFTTTTAAKTAIEKRKKEFALPRASSPPAPPYNSTTVGVNWTSGPNNEAIAPIMTKAISTITGAPMNWYVDGTSQTGSSYYSYTIYTTTEEAPGGVKQGLSDAINSAMSASTTAVIKGGDSVPVGSPMLTVTNSGTVIS